MNETTSAKRMLLGIQLSPFKTKPLIEFDRWKVYELAPLKEIEGHISHKNFQIEGSKEEKIVLRTWLNLNKEIIKVRYYYLVSMDVELAYYIVKAVMTRIEKKYPICNNVVIKDLTNSIV